MSLDMTSPPGAAAEARRQLEICNACRYCEGYCSVFPAMFRQRQFSDGDITQLANLCHNCRGCYYACQYTPPHEFDLNVPKILAEVRSESWEHFAAPTGLARLFQRQGVALAGTLVIAIALFFLALDRLRPASGEGFYAYLSHAAMIAIFIPAFLAPVVVLIAGLRRYWKEVGGEPVRWNHLKDAAASTARMKNLSGGQGQGCNFEKGDRFSQARRHAHQATLWGFLLCFASTSSATVLHYGFDLQAPYGPFSLPKLLGVPGGVLLMIGALKLAWLKTKADPELGAPGYRSGEMAFVLVLGLTGLTGLLLYAATGTALVPVLLAFHLGSVLTFFLTTPYSKMAHGAYRFAALVRDAQQTDA
jgi:citrate/tricarballylate utilization protein